MRPTDLNFRSPKEQTPGHNYEIYVNTMSHDDLVNK